MYGGLKKKEADVAYIFRNLIRKRNTEAGDPVSNRPGKVTVASDTIGWDDFDTELILPDLSFFHVQLALDHVFDSLAQSCSTHQAVRLLQPWYDKWVHKVVAGVPSDITDSAAVRASYSSISTDLEKILRDALHQCPCYEVN